MRAGKAASGLEIISELLNLTRRMVKSEDADLLVEAIDRRGELMAEYDALKASSAEAAAAIEKDKPIITEMIDEIVELDKKIKKSLSFMYRDAKSELQNSNKNKRILNYTNQAISPSGSYMDYKE